MLPGKRYKPEELLQIVTRRIWFLIIPWLLTIVATVVVAKLLPDRFRSESIILVVPPRVPDSIVRSATNAKIGDRLPSISQQILSRTRLERIIQDFNLYSKERKKALMENIVNDMRADIDVRMIKGDAFYVRYVSNDAKTAKQVTERLASLFVEDNLRDREVLTEGTNQFLESQLDDARRRLLEHEKKLEEYRKKYAGELPTQMGPNMQASQAAQNQMQALNDSIMRDRDRRLVLERALAEGQTDVAVTERAAAPTPTPPIRTSIDGSVTAPPGAPVSTQLAAANANLQAMYARGLTSRHPDVMRQKRQVEELMAQAASEPAKTPSGPTGPSMATLAAAAIRQNRLRDMKAEMETLDREIGRKQELQAKLQANITEYQRRAEMAPTRESELVALDRDYGTLQKVYNTLLSKSEDARLAANLEHRQIGEQFKIIDPARLPEQPFSPERVKIAGAGVAGGLVLGLALIGLLELRDMTFRTDADIVSVLALPVLALVPAIISDAERRATRRMQFIVAVTTIVVIAAGSGLAWKLRLQDWLR
jgi:polysaccharide chain length determinant protein (PEP-CTERM system associated)